MNSRFRIFASIALLAAAICVAPASASFVGDTIFSIQADMGESSARFDVPLTVGRFNDAGDTMSWQLDAPQPLTSDSGQEVGTLLAASVQYVEDPIVVVNFLVSTGNSAANFTITSAQLTFPSIGNAIGTSSAAISVTDNGRNGASLTGNFPGSLAYRSFYNDPGGAATGLPFSTLVPAVTGPSNSSVVSTGAYPMPLGTYSSMDQSGNTLGSVSSMSAQWSFQVGPNDSASGTSFFEIIVPEPASALLGLFGFLGLTIIRRRHVR